MKKLTLLFLMLVSLTVSSCKNDRADEGYFWGHGFGMGYGAGCFEERGEMMNQLGIKGADADKIASIDEKYRRLYYENRGDYEKIDALRIKHREEIKNSLGADQQKKFDGIYSKRWENWGHAYGRRNMGDYYGHGYGMGFGSGCWGSRDSMTEYLKLSPDQADKISAIDNKYRDLYYQNRNDFNKIDSLRVNHRKEIGDVLTPEQKKQFSEIYDNRWRGRGHMGRGMMGY